MEFTCQRQLFGVFESPLDFIEAYAEIYDNQKKEPIKVFYDEIPYSQVFEQQILNSLYECKDETMFFKTEKLIDSMKQREFYDHRFYDRCKDLYIKVVAVLLDNVENSLFNDEILLGHINYQVFTEDTKLQKREFVENVLKLYKFTNYNINITNFLVYLMENNFKKSLGNIKAFVDQMCIHKYYLHELNKALLVFPESKFRDERELYKKISISEYLLGAERVLEYSFDEYFVRLLSAIKVFIESQEPDNAYLMIMNLLSELSLRDIGIDEKLLEGIKNLAKSLLV